MATESSIVTSILTYLSERGAKAVKVHGGPFTERGTPDVFACLGGRTVVIEVKRPSEEPSAVQLTRLEQWRAAGAVAFVATSVGEVRNALAREGLPV